MTGDGVLLVGNVERGAHLADWRVEFIPLELRGMIGVGFERGFIGKLHDDDVRFLYLRALGILDLDGVGPDAGDALVGGGKFFHAVESGLDLLWFRVGFESDGHDVDHGLGRGLSRSGDGAEREEAGGEETQEDFFHDDLGSGWMAGWRADDQQI